MNKPKQKGGSVRAVVATFLFLALYNIINVGHAVAGISVPCRAYIGYPLPNQELPIDYRTARDDCPTGTPEGLQTVTGTVYGAPAGTTITVTSTFIQGRPSGTTTLTSSFGLLFVGNIQNDGTVVGKTTYPDGHSDEGTSSHGKLVTGMITRPAAMGGGVNYFIQSASVTREQYVSFVSHNIQSPARTPASTQVVADNSSPAPPKTETRTSQSGRDNSQCFADRPTAWYTVTGTYEGECVGGNFTGRAEMRLIPKDPQDATMTIIAPYRDGQIAGDVEIQYPQINAVYRGSLQQWSPYNGRMSQNLGNRTFEISEFRNGETVATRREYKQPSEFETAFIGILSAELNKGINRTLDSAFNGAQKRHDRRVAQAAQNQQMVAAQSSQNANTSVFTNQNRQSASVAVLGNSGSNAQTGTYQAGAPLGQPVAKNETPPQVFGGNTSPPEVTTAPPQFGGSTSPQTSIVGTQPPVDTGVPPPVPANQTLPAPTSGYTAQPPALPPPTQKVPLLPPQAQSNVNAPSQTLPAPTYNDTLSSGRVENPNVPAPIPTGVPNQGQQNVQYQQSPNQTAQQPRQLASVPSVPSNARTNTVNSPRVSMQWNQVSGATYYDFGLRDISSGNLIIDQHVNGSSVETTLVPGGQYRWNVAACNSNGCSPFTSAIGFTLAGGASSPAAANKSVTGFLDTDRRWIASLPTELQIQVLSLTPQQVDAYRARGEWIRFKTIVTEAAGEIRNATIEKQREELAIWENAWNQSQKVLIEGGLLLLPVDRIAVAVNDMARLGRISQAAKVGTITTIALPEALTIGANSERGINVYLAYVEGKAVYCGITCNIAARTIQHGDRFDRLVTLTQVTLTRGEARAVEEALIARNPEFYNMRHEIATSQPYYDQAVRWGENWLRTHGY